jgi:hypothetical protein
MHDYEPKKNINQQLFTFNKHKTSHVETFVTTILYSSKSKKSFKLKYWKKNYHLNIQPFKICHQQVMNIHILLS